jgi:hypothetical protein
VAAVGRTPKDFVTYSRRVEGVTFRLANVANGEPFEIRERSASLGWSSQAILQSNPGESHGRGQGRKREGQWEEEGMRLRRTDSGYLATIDSRLTIVLETVA